MYGTTGGERMKPGVLRSACTILTLVSTAPIRIEMRAVLDARHHIGIGPRTDLPAFMAVADKLAVLLRAEPDVVARFGAIGRNGEALVARRDELDRPVEPSGRERDERRARRHHALRAERAADIAADHTHLVRLDAEPLRDAILEAVDELARLIDGELVVRPHAGGREQLDRVVVLRRRLVFRIDRRPLPPQSPPPHRLPAAASCALRKPWWHPPP